MNISPHTKRRVRGLTLVEVLVVIAILFIFIAVILPTQRTNYPRRNRIWCVNNLKQVGLALRVWEGDNGDKYPWDPGQTNVSMMEFSSGPNLWRYFQIASNELSTPKILYCPDDKLRVAATNFTYFNNSNISYFISLDAAETGPEAILSGDRNITNGTPIENGVLKLIPNRAAGWTKQMHNGVGDILLMDGSVQLLSSATLQSGIVNVTNRLLMPILGP